jgi:NAD(P)H-flavin reductase
VEVGVVQIRPTAPFPYLPGQSFAMEIPQRPRLWRYYSPANAPREDDSIELHVQVVDGGQVSSPLVRSLRPGDTVKLGAPVGDQLIRSEGDPRNLVMVAGGTGLAPLRAVLEQIDAEWRRQGSGPQVQLFHGARTAWSLYDRDRLQAMAAERPWFSYTEVVSDDPSYPGARGYVGSVAAARLSGREQAALVCGGPEMVTHTVDELATAGISLQDIHYEQFNRVSAGESVDAAVSLAGDHQ